MTHLKGVGRPDNVGYFLADRITISKGCEGSRLISNEHSLAIKSGHGDTKMG